MNYIIKSIYECDDLTYKYIYDNLGDYEKKKINKLLNKKLSLLGYYELYLLLKEKNIDLFKTKIKYNKFNKPYIDNIYYNIAHDNEMTICIVSDVPVGVDIIYLKRKNKNIDKRSFAIKEAYIKMIGGSILNIKIINLDYIYFQVFVSSKV